MSRKYRFGESSKLHFISFAIVYWIDLFVRNEYREILIESWKYCQKEKDLEIYGWCIMTSHVHMIIGGGSRDLDKIVGEMKSFTSGSLRKAITNNPAESRKEWLLWMMERAGKKNSNNKDWQLWKQHNHPIELLNKEMFFQKLEYIHRNPVEAGFVEKQEEYLYSSAKDFYNGKGIIELSFLN